MRILLAFIMVIITTINASAVFTDIKWVKLSFPTDSSEIISLDQISYDYGKFSLFAVTSQNELYSYKNGITLKCPTGNLIVNSVVCAFQGKVFIGTDSGVYRSDNEGISFTKFSQLLPAGKAVVFNSGGSNQENVYAWIPGNDVFNYKDTAKTWTRLNIEIGSAELVSIYSRDAKNNGLIITTKNDGIYIQKSPTDSLNKFDYAMPIGTTGTAQFGNLLATNTGLFMLNGYSKVSDWKDTTGVLAGKSVSSITYTDDCIMDFFDGMPDPAPDNYLVGTRDSGFYYESNKYNKWIHAIDGLEDLHITTMSLRLGRNLFAGTKSKGVFKTLYGIYYSDVIDMEPDADIAVTESKDEFIISSRSGYLLSGLSIYNINGMLVAQNSGNEGLEQRISKSSLNSGVYFYRVFHNGKAITGKMLVGK